MNTSENLIGERAAYALQQLGIGRLLLYDAIGTDNVRGTDYSTCLLNAQEAVRQIVQHAAPVTLPEVNLLDQSRAQADLSALVDLLRQAVPLAERIDRANGHHIDGVGGTEWADKVTQLLAMAELQSGPTGRE